MNMDPAGLLLPHFGHIRENVRAFLETNIEMIRRWTSMATETVKAGKPLDQVYEAFMADVMNRSGLARDEIPDPVARNIRFSAIGCYAYTQEKIVKQ
jgi:hypothetical protein